MVGSLACLPCPWLKLTSCWTTGSHRHQLSDQVGTVPGRTRNFLVVFWVPLPESHLREGAILFTYLITKPAPLHQGPKPIQPLTPS